MERPGTRVDSNGLMVRLARAAHSDDLMQPHHRWAAWWIAATSSAGSTTSRRSTTGARQHPGAGQIDGPFQARHRESLADQHSAVSETQINSSVRSTGARVVHSFVAERLAAVAAVVTTVAAVVPTILSSVAPAVDAVCHDYGSAHSGDRPSPAPGCHRHLSLLPLRLLRRRLQQPLSRPEWGCAHWRPAGHRHGARPNRTARPTGSPTQGRQRSCPARWSRPGR